MTIVTPDATPSLFADLCAKIDLHLGSTTKALDRMSKQRRKPPAQPVFGRVAASGLGVDGAALILRLGGPDQGHFWYVRNLVVGGLSPTTTAAGRVDVYVSATNLQAQRTLAAVGLGDWRDQSLALPNIAFYGRGEIPLRLNEELFVIFSNVTNAQSYVAAAQYEDYEEAASPQGWDL